MRIDNYVVEGRKRLAFLEDNIEFRDAVIDSLGEKLPESRFRDWIVDPYGEARDVVCDKTAHSIGRIGVMQAVAREIERVSDWSVAKPDDICRYFSEYTSGIFDEENSCGARFLQTDSVFAVPSFLKVGVAPGELEKSIKKIGYALREPELIHNLDAKENEDGFDFVGSPHVSAYVKVGDVFIPRIVERDGRYTPFFYSGSGRFENRVTKKIIWNTDGKKFYLNDDILANQSYETKTPLIADS